MAATKRVNWEMRADEDVTATLARIASSLDLATNKFDLAKKVLGGLFAGVSVAAFASGIKSAIDYADALNDLSKKTGVAVETLDGLDYAAKQTGTSLEVVAKGLFNLNKAAFEAASGSKEMQKLFDVLGVDAQKVLADTEEGFLDVVDALNKIEQPGERAAVAAKLFNKTAAEMLPLVTEGSAALRALIEEKRKYGGVTAETATRADAFNDTLEKIKMSTGALWRNLASDLLPTFQGVAEVFVSYKERGTDVSAVSNLIAVGIKGIAAAAVTAAHIVERFVDWLGALGTMTARILTGDFSGADLIIDEVHKRGDEAQALLGERLGKIIDGVAIEVKPKAKAAGEGIAGSLNDGAAKELEKLQEKVQAILGRVFGKESGLDADFAATLKTLEEGYRKGLIPSVEEYRKAIEALIKQQPFYKKGVEDAMKDAKALADDERVLADAFDKSKKAADDLIGTIARQNKDIEFEISILGLSKEARELAILTRQKELDIIKATTPEQRELIENLYAEKEAIVRRRQGVNRALDDTRNALENQVSMWGQLSDAAGNFFSDLVMNGASAFDNLKQMLKSFLAELIALFARRWVLQMVAGFSGAGGAGSVAANAGGSAVANAVYSAVGSYLGQTAIGAYMGGAYTSFVAGWQGATLGAGLAGPTTAGATGMMGAGATAHSAAGIAASLWWILPIVIGVMANSRYFGQGWRIDNDQRIGSQGLRGVALGAASMDDRAFRALGFNDYWASMLSGSSLTTRLFGHGPVHADARGVEGVIGGGGITGQAWQDWSRRGGTFASDIRGTERAPFDTGQQDFFDSVMRGIGTVLGSFGTMLGVDPAAATAGYSRPFNLQLTENGQPLTDEQLGVLFGNLFGSVLQDQVALVFDAAGRTELSEYVRGLVGSGEEVTAMIQELAGVMQGLARADILGMSVETLMLFQREGETLGQAFERVGGQWSQFQQLFLSDAERIAMVQDGINSVFATLGIAVPDSMEAFRHLVEGIDLTTESGRTMFAALMDVAPAFAAVTNAATTAVNRFHQLASQLSPQYGAANARSILEARTRTWMDLAPGNSAGWTVDSTIGNIGELVRTGQLGAALTYAQSLGGNAVTVLNDMIEAYIAWQDALRGSTGPIQQLGGVIGDLGGLADDTALRLANARGGLRTYLDSLILDPQLSPLDPQAQLTEAVLRFSRTAEAARNGDIRAIEELPGLGQMLLGLGRTVFASGSGYQDLFGWVQLLGGQIAGPPEGASMNDLHLDSQSQLTELREIRALLIGIRDQNAAASAETVDATLESAEKVSRSVRLSVAPR